jgi:predicted DsbA family dithiol-disulfide isomerase
MTIENRLHQRVGSDNVEKIKAVMDRSGTVEGIVFNYGGKIGNTRDSHRVLSIAGQKSPAAQCVVSEALFKGLFEEQQDITSHEFLINAARAAGLDEEVVLADLKEGKGGEEIDHEVAQAVSKGVRAVPHFTINGRHEMSGSQDPSELMEIFTKVKEVDTAA